MAKEVWLLLLVTHEGKSAVKMSKLQMYTAQLKVLKMEEDEEVSQFNVDIPKSKVVQKVLKSLLKKFKPKVITIEESKDIETIKLEELIGSLQTFETAIKVPTKTKGIAHKVEEPFVSTEDSDDDLALVAKKFKKFF